MLMVKFPETFATHRCTRIKRQVGGGKAPFTSSHMRTGASTLPGRIDPFVYVRGEHKHYYDRPTPSLGPPVLIFYADSLLNRGGCLVFVRTV